MSYVLPGLVVVAACSVDEAPPARARRGEPQEVIVALCETRDAVGRGAGATKAMFLDRAHDRLHDLASDTAEIDRSIAARLLEAKQAVESTLEEAPSRRIFRDNFDALISATRRALEVTSGAAPDCAQGTDGG